MKPLQLYIDYQLHRDLKHKAAEEGTSISELVRAAIVHSVKLPNGNIATRPVEEAAMEAPEPDEVCIGHPFRGDCGKPGCKYKYVPKGGTL